MYPLAVASLVCKGLRFLMVCRGHPAAASVLVGGEWKGRELRSAGFRSWPGKVRSGKGELALGAYNELGRCRFSPLDSSSELVEYPVSRGPHRGRSVPFVYTGRIHRPFIPALEETLVNNRVIRCLCS